MRACSHVSGASLVVLRTRITLGGAARQPDVVAYGRDVLGSRIQGGCRSLSGTSVASPVVAGAVCLLASVVPEPRCARDSCSLRAAARRAPGLGSCKRRCVLAHACALSASGGADRPRLRGTPEHVQRGGLHCIAACWAARLNFTVTFQQRRSARAWRAQVARRGRRAKPGGDEAGAGGGRGAHPGHQHVRAGAGQAGPAGVHGAPAPPPPPGQGPPPEHFGGPAGRLTDRGQPARRKHSVVTGGACVSHAPQRGLSEPEQRRRQRSQAHGVACACANPLAEPGLGWCGSLQPLRAARAAACMLLACRDSVWSLGSMAAMAHEPAPPAVQARCASTACPDRRAAARRKSCKGTRPAPRSSRLR